MWKRVSALWTVVRGDARRFWRVLRHPQAPGWFKLGAVGMVLYLLSPVDLIPDFIPGLGLVDDLVIVPLAMRWLLDRLPMELRAHADGASRARSA